MNITLKITGIYSRPTPPERAWRSCRRRERKTFGMNAAQWKKRCEQAGIPHDDSAAGPKLVRKAA